MILLIKEVPHWGGACLFPLIQLFSLVLNRNYSSIAVYDPWWWEWATSSPVSPPGRVFLVTSVFSKVYFRWLYKYEYHQINLSFIYLTFISKMGWRQRCLLFEPCTHPHWLKMSAGCVIGAPMSPTSLDPSLTPDSLNVFEGCGYRNAGVSFTYNWVGSAIPRNV